MAWMMVAAAGLSAYGAITSSQAAKAGGRAAAAAYERNAEIDRMNAAAAVEQAELAASIYEENALLVEQDSELQYMLLLQDSQLATFAGYTEAQDVALVTRVEFADNLAKVASSGIDVESASSVNFMAAQLDIAQDNIHRIVYNAEIQAVARENEATRVVYAGDVAAKGQRDNARQERLKGELSKKGSLMSAANNVAAAGSAVRVGNANANAALISGFAASATTLAMIK